MSSREKLQRIEVLGIRNLSRAQARKEILEYIKGNGNAWTSDIANALKLDLDLVLAILKELRQEGLVVENDLS